VAERAGAGRPSPAAGPSVEDIASRISGRGGHRGPGFGGARFLEPREKPKDARSSSLRLWKRFGSERGSLVLASSLILIECAAVLAAPRFIGFCVDAMVPGSGSPPLAFAVSALLAAYGTAAISSILNQRAMAGATQRIARALRLELFAKMRRLPVSTFDSRSRGDLMSRLSNDVDSVSSTIAQSATQIISTAFIIAGALAMMIILSPVLTLAALVTVPLVTLLAASISKRTRRLFREQQAALGALNGIVEETISGIEAVKAFGREDASIRGFWKENRILRSVGTKALVWSGLIMPFTNVIANLGLAAIAVVGGVLASRGEITVGTIAAFVAYSRQFTRPLNELANAYNSLLAAVAGAERVFEIIDEDEEVEDPADAVRIEFERDASRGGPGAGAVRGDMEFDSVSFSYRAGRKVIDDLSFFSPAGSVTALVGPTGAGKTTIANLIARFYDPDSGSIRLDGVELSGYARRDLRRLFGIVPQDSYLFSGSVRDNILYADPEAGEGAMISAAEAANADKLIRRLPAGYDTRLGEGAPSLSEGMRQLIAIARAVLAKPSILILDEATSGVDTRTESHIQEAMISLMRGRTSFIIAHRLSTIKFADRILVIDAGKLAESGTHEELSKRGGLYERMRSSQA
jgi:ATP-binding cassette, subfamily B, multidrug efflux pump